MHRKKQASNLPIEGAAFPTHVGGCHALLPG